MASCWGCHDQEREAVSAPKEEQWSVSTNDPRLVLDQETPDLHAAAVACVRQRCPDDAGLILDALGLSEVAS